MGLPQAKRDSSTVSELSAAMMSTIKSNGHVRAQSLDLKGGHVRSSSAGSQKIFLSLRKVSDTSLEHGYIMVLDTYYRLMTTSLVNSSSTERP